MEKRLVIVVKSKPYTTLNTYEALRLAMGLWEHEVSVVWMGDGVYALLGAADMSLDGVFHADLPDLHSTPMSMRMPSRREASKWTL